ncbi:MAG: efflux RND transporter periplasmic adaptor subunit [Pseudoalteromonas spongiae]|uniref:efflux RND transporter periplasmic adaptor subunit n=1 Tax=Pseudoalteromonas TaxID=53246 RepID=UPI000CF6FD09|nr:MULTISPECIES: efflux RND transporter periplasmic adaptor subunit [Pseudoalteromonas]TMO84088.1 efflux RND transporter periplasmic adaptor subunit [Pseudoalteromonas spongiae]
MTKKTLLIPIVAILALVAMIIMMAGGFSDKIAPSTASPQLQNVQTITIEPYAYTDRLWLPANLIAKQNTQVASRILANVTSVNVRAGDMVQAGDVIAELDNQDLKAQVRQIEAQVEAVSAQLTQASLQLKRNKALREQGLISVNDLDSVQSTFDQLRATKLSYEQQRDQANVTLAYSKIIAPIAGKVVDRMVEPGDLVNPGQAVVALYNPSSIQISSYIPESQAVTLALGQALQVELSALQQVRTARISEIVPLADSAARSFEVKLDLAGDNLDGSGLMPGMYAKVGIDKATRDVIAIDKRYIQQFGQLSKVSVLENNQVSERFVRLGQQLDNNLVIIISGLSAGEKLVI